MRAAALRRASWSPIMILRRISKWRSATDAHKSTRVCAHVYMRGMMRPSERKVLPSNYATLLALNILLQNYGRADWQGRLAYGRADWPADAANAPSPIRRQPSRHTAAMPLPVRRLTAPAQPGPLHARPGPIRP